MLSSLPIVKSTPNRWHCFGAFGPQFGKRFQNALPPFRWERHEVASGNFQKEISGEIF